ncbi:MAG: succinate--CoA ligase subunit beta, partial [Nostoc sp.]
RLEIGLKMLEADKSIQVILINFLGSIPQIEEVAEVIARVVQQDNSELQSQVVRSNGSKVRRELNFPSLVVRLAGSEFNTVRKYLTTLKTHTDALVVVENLDEAVSAAVLLA